MDLPVSRAHNSRWPAALMTAATMGIAVLGAFLGSGAFGGTPIQQASDGYLGPDSTLLAPSTPAFSIWSLIYCGLIVYAVYQLTPAGRQSQTAARYRLPASAAALLNAVWILVAQSGLLGASVVVIFILLMTLGWLIAQLNRHQTETRSEHWIMWVTFGVYLGWVSIASIANTAAWLASLGIGISAPWAPGAAIALISAAVMIGFAATAYGGGHLEAALAMAWGLGWIGHSRLSGSNQSDLVGISALIAAGILALGSVLLAVRAWRRGRR